MSRQSDRKKARRQKRLAQRVVWSSADDEVEDEDEDPDQIADLVTEAQDFDRRIAQREWTFDTENSTAGLASWYYAPSGYEPEDDDVEAVTRVWFTTTADDDSENFPQSVHVIMAGSAQARRVSVDQLFDELVFIEAHRANGRA
jgi:hypothetical protein